MFYGTPWLSIIQQGVDSSVITLGLATSQFEVLEVYSMPTWP